MNRLDKVFVIGLLRFILIFGALTCAVNYGLAGITVGSFVLMLMTPPPRV